MTINLTQIRSDFDNGIIVSKQTLLALVDYAIELETKQEKSIEERNENGKRINSLINRNAENAL